MNKTCSFLSRKNFTKIKNYNLFLSQLSFNILKLINSGCTNFNTGLLSVSDMDFAEVVIWLRDEKQLSISLDCTLAFISQCEKWQESNIQRYYSILSSCNNFKIISHTKSFSSYCDQKKFLIDNANFLMSYQNNKIAIENLKKVL